MKFKICLFSLALMIISCKEVKNENQMEVIDVPVKPRAELFQVSLDLIIKKDDSLQLFYMDENMTIYDGSKTVWSIVKGSDNPQEVIFMLPRDILPYKIRLDFGTNKEQLPIAVKSFSMKYRDKNFHVKDTMFYQYFIPNDQINWDRKEAVATTIYKEGVFYDPGFNCRETLELELEKIIH